jgi:hypothetical protein
MHRVCSAIVLSTLLLAPAVARADDDDGLQPLPVPPQTSATQTQTIHVEAIDSVHLRNGTLYRGHVAELVPGDHVTIKTETGDSKRVAWTDIEKVIIASSPPPTTTAPAASPVEPPPPMVGPKARVHITSSKRVLLYRRPAGSGGWYQACASPCDMELPTGDTYRIHGNNIPNSKEIRLDVGPSGFVDLHVDPPNTGGMVLGGIVAGGGGLTFMVGALVALVGAANAGLDCNNYDHRYYTSQAQCQKAKDDGPGLRNGGLIALGIGAAVTGAGLLVIFNSATTDVDQHGGKKSSNDAFVRLPGWKAGASSAENATPPPAAAFPVMWQGTF